MQSNEKDNVECNDPWQYVNYPNGPFCPYLSDIIYGIYQPLYGNLFQLHEVFDSFQGKDLLKGLQQH